ncbi:hypothetical protein G7Z17_g5017 [Cylindrodendrum hubeiense]|uniref:Infection structure specific protein n=1 Tax=Cylindrodendrum hubeiense TaxID=595255 RepID=A0A9P5LC47_9HYPO|nr:hypothetical protein G7Z17_g5017 [Cylindrodendrum hubeiense]
MGRFILLSVISALASQALASNPLLEELGVSPVFPPHEAPVQRRDIDEACFSSVASELSPPEPSATELNEWASTASSGILPCIITAPATLSDEFISYLGEVETWLETVESKAEAIDTKCDADEFTFTVSLYCTESRTVVFTGTKNSTSSTVMEPMDGPTGVIYIGAAARNDGMARIALVVAAVLSVAIAL